MKRWLNLALLVFGSYCHAQFVTITGNVVDPTGAIYQNGSGRVVLVPQNQSFFVNGTNPVISPVVIGGLDSFGHFSVQLTNTSLITPASANPQWEFSFCSTTYSVQTGPICFTMTPMSLTTSQDISTQIQAQAALLPNLGGITGSGASTQVAIWTGATSLVGDPGFTYIHPGATATILIGAKNSSTGSLSLCQFANDGCAVLSLVTRNSTAIFSLPNGSGGTLAASASSPLVLDATTGNLTCPTCGAGTITGATTGGGLVVTGTTLGMLTTCSTNQILQWSGTAWACANAGSGTVTGTGTTHTLPRWSNGAGGVLEDSHASETLVNFVAQLNFDGARINFTQTDTSGIALVQCFICNNGLWLTGGSSSGSASAVIIGSGGSIELQAHNATQFQSFLVNIDTSGNGWIELPEETLANLPTAVNSSVVYCTNCHENTDPCSTSGGTGSGDFAFKINGRWKCY